MKVNILGTYYEIKEQTPKENPKLEDSSGICETYSKELILDFSDYDPNTHVSNYDAYKHKVLRHEIIHAYFHEIGDTDRCHDEELVEKLAILIPKIVQSMKEVGCLE